ncbi:hypothetical protein PROFUN_15712 [Planoprotostelium fungivorum]|uniref:HNH nuclease domain-containing protein n=1 Tax=Planoprotostelium fungivorum TaxID=1890364 RepID=A0A2P6MUK4_9EUKA|nr:hypothetical protein PROFUN_15712 [Planoprotostelium fungivorum]
MPYQSQQSIAGHNKSLLASAYSGAYILSLLCTVLVTITALDNKYNLILGIIFNILMINRQITMAYIYRAKNGDATNEYRFPSAATANALALKFNLDPDPIPVCSDAECRNDVGDISAIGAGTYYVDGRPHTAQGAAPPGLYGALRASQGLACIAAALEFVSAVVLRDNELIFLLTLTLEFKNSLISYYDRKDPQSSDIKCMVLDRFYPQDKVRGSHIWKYATYGEGLDEFGLKEDDVNKERNGLLLGEGIEQAFDSKQLCFLYDALNTKKFVVKVLDPDLLRSSTPVSPSQTRTFSDINNLPLCLPADRSPFRRLLSWHAKCTYTTALKKKWIEQPAFDTFTTYDNLSNGARPDFLEDLDNEE